MTIGRQGENKDSAGSNGVIINEQGEQVGSNYKGVELTGEDDTPEMRALIDQVTADKPDVIDVTPTTPAPELPSKT